MTTGENYIGYSRSAMGTKVFQTYNPLLNQHNEPTFTEANSEEIEKAVQLAHDCSIEYSRVSGAKKAKFLRTISEEIMNLGDSLIEMYTRETGLPIGRVKGERGRTIGQINMFADLVEKGDWVQATIDRAQPERSPLPRLDHRKMLVSIGPVVVFGASNFPLAYSTAGGDTASALAAGCPVIVKSHPMHAGTGELVAGAIAIAAQKTGMPDGVFSNLNSSDKEVGIALVNHPKVKAVGFTGSIRGGRALMDIAAARKEPIPVFAEMGSINPVVLLPKGLSNNLEHWAQQYAKSIQTGTGQFCTNPGLILGMDCQDLTDFGEQLGQILLSSEQKCMLHPDIKANFNRLKELVSTQDGVQILAQQDENNTGNFASQMLLLVDGEVFLNNKNLHHEVFGPSSIIVKCKDEFQLKAIIENLEGQLTGTIIAESSELEIYKDVVSAMSTRVGRLVFNGVPTGVEVCESMVHGGPYPASSDARYSAVGVTSIVRWARPICYQNWPNNKLPDALKDENPLGLNRIESN